MLFVLSTLGVGGSETKIVRVANDLARSGVQVELAYLNPPETLLSQVDSAISVTHLHRRGKYSISSLRRLCGIVKRERQTVIAVNPYALLYVIPAVKWLRSSRIRVVGLVNTSVSIGRERLFEKVFTLFLKQCDKIVFGCEAQKRHWVERHGLCAETSQVIYNGVDSTLFSPTRVFEEGVLLRRKLGIPDDAKIIGSVGRFQPEKSHAHLVLALSKLNRLGRASYGVLVGEGVEKESLKQLAKTEGIEDKIKFPGLLHDVRPALSIMDVFVLPSVAVETFSNAALEAMAMARAVVLSEIGGATEMIENNISGMIYPRGDVDALIEILIDLHDSREKRRALGSAARSRVLASFGFSEMVCKYKALMSF